MRKSWTFQFQKLKFSRNAAGFSLLEILMVIGLLAVVGVLGLFMSMDSFRGYAFRNERDTIISVLQKARSQAVSNVCLQGTVPACTDGQPHGVHFLAGQYIIFQGNVYVSGNSLNQVIVSNNPNAAVAGMTDVVFSQLSGEAAPAGNITVSDSFGHTSVISINSAGQITWTN